MHHCVLPNRTIIRLRGADCRELLQGIITNDITRLNEQPLIFAAMLSAQGKIQHDFFIMEQDDSVLLDTEAHLKDALIKKLKMYRLRAHADIIDESRQWNVVAWWGEGAPPSDAYPDPRLKELGWRAIVPTNSAKDGEPFDAYDIHRLTLGVPDGSRDTTERTVIMENGYDMLNAVSFSKGCYVGQEVTARMHYRKVLRKCLFTVTSDQPLPETGTPIFLDDAQVGEMRSSNGPIGLALLRLNDWSEKGVYTTNNLEINTKPPLYMHAKITDIQTSENTSQ